ncbi:MAG TPA: hypothetical protein PLT65_03050 [Bacilli bacterium]|nr:hypothetical protein [Bacilli bacterium]
MNEEQIKSIKDQELVSLYNELIKEIGNLEKDLTKIKEGDKNA